MNIPIMAVLLCVFQGVCTVISGGAQFKEILKTTKGLCITFFVFSEVFIALNLWMIIDAQMTEPGSGTVLTIVSYCIFAVMNTMCLIALLVKWEGWSRSDTYAMLFGGGGVLFTAALAVWMRADVRDPMIRASLGVFCMGIPQSMLAYAIWEARGGGPPGWTILMGHVALWSRFGQLVYSVFEATEWESNRLWALVSEAANAASWLLVTVVWWIYQKNSKTAE